MCVDGHPGGDERIQTIAEYLYDKATHDSGDPGFGRIISDDVYPISYNASGTGEVDVKLRRIMAEFETYQGNQNQSLAGLDIASLSPLYFVNSRDARLAVPMDVGLGSLSPVLVRVGADGVTREYEYDYVDFGTNSTILVNLAQDNELTVTRHRGSVTVDAPAGFGDITGLYVDGILANITCSTTCVVNTLDDSGMQISAENRWGGKAHADVAEFVPEAVQHVSVSELFIPVLFVAGLPVLYWIYRHVKNRD